MKTVNAFVTLAAICIQLLCEPLVHGQCTGSLPASGTTFSGVAVDTITVTSYSNAENCVWNVNCPSGSQFQVLALSTDTESCCDYVKIEHTAMSSAVKKFSGKGVYSMATSYQSAIVRFTSDTSITKTGFNLTYVCRPATCLPLTYGGAPALNCSSVAYCPEDHDVVHVGDVSFSGGSSATGPDLQVVGPMGLIYEKEGSQINSIPWRSTKSSALLHFTRQDSSNPPEFTFTYQCSLAPCVSANVSGSRYANLTKGTIVSAAPGAGSSSQSPPGQWCFWSIQCSSLMEVMFPSISTNIGSSKLDIYSPTSSVALNDISGRQTLHAVLTHSQEVYIVYSGSSSTSYPYDYGFELSFTCGIGLCTADVASGSILTSKQGTIASDSDGIGTTTTYIANEACRWEVHCGEGYVFSITNMSYYIEYGYDYLTLSDASSRQQLLRVSGYDGSGGFVTNSSKVHIAFTSDPGTENGGYRIDYKCLPLQCTNGNCSVPLSCPSGAVTPRTAAFFPNTTGAIIDLNEQGRLVAQYTTDDEQLYIGGALQGTGVLSSTTSMEVPHATFMFSYKCNAYATCNSPNATGSLYRNLTGTIELSSPTTGFPAQDCFWSVLCPHGHVFSIAHLRRSNVYQTFILFSDASGSLLAVYGQYASVENLNLDRQQVFIDFSYREGYRAGFNLDYKCLKSGCSSVNDTGSIYTAPNGTIYSDEDGFDGPVPYLAKENCSWTVRCPTNTSFSIANLSMDISDLSDVLELFDEPTGLSLALYQFSGLSQGLLTNAQNVTIRFASLRAYTHAGWSLRYSCVAPQVRTSTSSEWNPTCPHFFSLQPQYLTFMNSAMSSTAELRSGGEQVAIFTPQSPLGNFTRSMGDSSPTLVVETNSATTMFSFRYECPNGPQCRSPNSSVVVLFGDKPLTFHVPVSHSAISTCSWDVVCRPGDHIVFTTPRSESGAVVTVYSRGPSPTREHYWNYFYSFRPEVLSSDSAKIELKVLSQSVSSVVPDFEITAQCQAACPGPNATGSTYTQLRGRLMSDVDGSGPQKPTGLQHNNCSWVIQCPGGTVFSAKISRGFTDYGSAVTFMDALTGVILDRVGSDHNLVDIKALLTNSSTVRVAVYETNAGNGSTLDWDCVLPSSPCHSGPSGETLCSWSLPGCDASIDAGSLTIRDRNGQRQYHNFNALLSAPSSPFNLSYGLASGDWSSSWFSPHATFSINTSVGSGSLIALGYDCVSTTFGCDSVNNTYNGRTIIAENGVLMSSLGVSSRVSQTIAPQVCSWMITCPRVDQFLIITSSIHFSELVQVSDSGGRVQAAWENEFGGLYSRSYNASMHSATVSAIALSGAHGQLPGGYFIEWFCVTGTCSCKEHPNGAVLTAETGSLSSDTDGIGPRQYPKGEACTWTIRCPSNDSYIRLTDIHADISYEDRLFLSSGYHSMQIYSGYANWRIFDVYEATVEWLSAASSQSVNDGWTFNYECVSSSSAAEAPPASSNTVAIAAGAGGGGALLLILIVVAVCMVRRKKSRQSTGYGQLDYDPEDRAGHGYRPPNETIQEERRTSSSQRNDSEELENLTL